MTRNIISSIGIISLCFATLFFASCSKDEHKPLNSQYVIIKGTNAESRGPVYSDREFIAEYLVELSSQVVREEFSVDYELIVGKSLESGRDFQLLNTDNGKLVFPKGVYSMPIRIKWLSTVVREDPTNPTSDIISDSLKDGENDEPTLKIKLTSNSLNIDNEGWNQLNFPQEIEIRKIRAKQ